MMENLDDVAGIRVICSFLDDIYAVADMLARQDDVHIIAIKDYIRHPKKNGYRSYHMIVEIPVFFSDQKKWMSRGPDPYHCHGFLGQSGPPIKI